MRAIRELPLALSLVLTGSALFFGGGAEGRSLPWLGGGALLAILLAAATHGVPRGFASVLPLAALATWLAVSISWSGLPDRSWEYADRALVYVLFAVLGLWLADRRRHLALGLLALVAAVVAWSLLGKILPPVYDYGPPGVARLKGPIGLWNQLALVAAIGLPLALWRRRAEGALVAYGCLVALLLTYSRGGLATAILVLIAWFALSDDRLRSGVLLLAAALPGAVVVGIAFVLPGITSDHQSRTTRWHDGLLFGAVVVAGAVAAVLLARVRAPRDTPGLRRALVVLGAIALAAALVVVLAKADSFTSSAQVSNSGPARFSSGGSNFRTVWWKQAWQGWEGAKLVGTGAGSFHLTNLAHRDSYLDYTIEPHDLPLQMLSETGVVGLLLFLAAAAALLRHSGAFLRHAGARQAPELALALVLPAYLVHALVDVDWDFAAVSAPAFLVAGALAGRAPFRRVSPFAVLAATGAAAFAFAALLLPWLAARWADDALAASPARAVQLANRADSVDPLLVEPLWAKADAATILGENQRAFDLFVQATSRQPKNPQTWLQAGEFALTHRCWRLAYTYLERYVELDPRARASDGADDKDRALRLVNAGRNACGS